ncbi:MAG: hypothetical protein AB7L28_27965, partial [Kofleriaceae bacterium]
RSYVAAVRSRWVMLNGLFVVACGASSTTPALTDHRSTPTEPQTPAPAPDPFPPDLASYARMTPDQQCTAVAQRGVECADELVLEEARATLPDRELADVFEDGWRASPRATEDAAQAIHELMCVEGADYTDSLLACWTTSDCHAFAVCVIARRTRP